MYLTTTSVLVWFVKVFRRQKKLLAALLLAFCFTPVFKEFDQMKFGVGTFSFLLPVRDVARLLGVHFRNQTRRSPYFWFAVSRTIFVHVSPTTLLNTKTIFHLLAPVLGTRHTKCLRFNVLVVRISTESKLLCIMLTISC